MGQFEEEEEIPVDVTSKGGKIEGEDDDMEERVEYVTRLVDEDQQGKALAIIGCGINSLPNQ